MSCNNCHSSAESSAVQKKVNAFAVAGFVIGVLSVWLSFYYCIASFVGIFVSIVGLFGWKGHRLNGFAIAGLIISILTLIGWGIVWLFIRAMIEALVNIRFN